MHATKMKSLVLWENIAELMILLTFTVQLTFASLLSWLMKL